MLARPRCAVQCRSPSAQIFAPYTDSISIRGAKKRHIMSVIGGNMNMRRPYDSDAFSRGGPETCKV